MKYLLISLDISLTAGVIVAIRVLSVRNGEPISSSDLGIVAAAVIVNLVGLYILSKQPKNSIGWVLLSGSACMFLAEFFFQYASYTLLNQPGALPFGLIAGWFSLWTWTPVIFCFIILLPMLFPTGRVISRGWRLIYWFAWILFLGSVFLFAFTPGPMEELGPHHNPLGLEFLSPYHEILLEISTVILLLLAGVAFVSIIMRYRISRGDERKQMKWFLFSGFLLFLNATRGIISEEFGIIPQLSVDLDNFLFMLNIAFIAVAIGIAILKYRLYDIDVIIRKTLLYGCLTAMLTLLFLGSVLLFQATIRPLSGQESTIEIVLATLIIAALFTPLRARLQQVIDRQFFRSRYNTEKILDSFGVSLRDQVDLEQVSDLLLGVVQDTMMPAKQSLWVNDQGQSPGVQYKSLNDS